ncbi:MAG TPA: MFS transporter [Clostridia bacterium]|nr:MFS transporter [Clostridia bacterium]
MLLLDGIFFRSSTAFWDASTIIPSLIHDLYGSRFLTGLVPTLRYGGWYAPQLLVAKYSERTVYKKRLLLFGYLIVTGSYSALTLLTLFGSPLWLKSSPLLVLGAYGLACIGDGVCGVPWWTLIAKTISPRRRGRLTGYSESVGSLMAFGAGFVVTTIIASGRFGFPDYYGVLFAIGIAVSLVSVVAIALIKEPPSLVGGQSGTSFFAFVKKAPMILKENPSYTRFVITKGLLMCHFLSLPFCITFARDVVGLPPQVVGEFISFQMVGGMLGSLVLGHLADRSGTRSAMILTAVGTFLIPCLPLICSLLANAVLVSPKSILIRGLLSATYVLIGLANVGSLIAMGNYVLEISTPQDRAFYVGLSNTLVFPASFLPALAGASLKWIGYEILFLMTAVIVGIGLVCAIRLDEPRALSHSEREKETNRWSLV